MNVRSCWVALLLFAVPALAQEVDEVTLKNGSVVRGSLIEFDPSAGGRIRTADGGVVVFEATEVVKMGKVRVAQSPVRDPKPGISPHVIIGAVGLGASYLLTVVVTAALNACCAVVAIPIIGPFLTIGEVANSGGRFYPGGEAMLIGSGVIQAGFATYLIVAAALGSAPEKTVRVLPTGTGVTVFGAF